MKITRLTDSEKPSFCWDRDWTVGEIRRRLREATGLERLQLTGWILREGAFQEIWSFFSPQEVSPSLDSVMPFLGRRKEYWRYTFDVWRKLGKI
jgi:hypothetical protein